MSQRIDKWLWHARVTKTRTLAAKLATSGKLRINGERIAKASHPVAGGDVLTFALAGRVRVFKVAGFADQRGAFALASTLYEDLSPPVESEAGAGEGGGRARPAVRPAGAGRPSKRERRRLDAFTAPED